MVQGKQANQRKGIVLMPPSPFMAKGEKKDNMKVPLPEGFRVRAVYKLILIVLLSLLAACTAQSNPTPTPQQPVVQRERMSSWGVVQRIAQAEDVDAPALLPRADDILLVWTGADENEARLYAQSKTGIQHILALKAYYPFEVSLFDGGEIITMLWQDRLPNEDTAHLLFATFTIDAVAERDVLSISRQGIRRYSAVQVPDTTIRTVFSIGEGMRSHLYSNQVDLLGRSQQPQLIRPNADYPALVLDNGGRLHLYWMENDGIVYHGWLDDRTGATHLEDIAAVSNLDLNAGDAIEDFTVAFDEAYAHLFWNIRQANGEHVVMYAYGHVVNGVYFAPRPLGIIQEPTTIETSYNSGVVYTAHFADANFAAWATPLKGQHSILPVAIQQDDWLGVAYFQNGAMIGYQDVIETGTLIGTPTIGTERNRHLYLAWSEPTTVGYANLFMTTSRR